MSAGFIENVAALAKMYYCITVVALLFTMLNSTGSKYKDGLRRTVNMASDYA